MSKRPTPRTWNDGWRCAECCTGDRCDDPSHYDRAKCPHCHGTGSAIWNMYNKENDAKALKRQRDELAEALREVLSAPRHDPNKVYSQGQWTVIRIRSEELAQADAILARIDGERHAEERGRR